MTGQRSDWKNKLYFGDNLDILRAQVAIWVAVRTWPIATEYFIAHVVPALARLAHAAALHALTIRFQFATTSTRVSARTLRPQVAFQQASPQTSRE